MRLVGYAAAAAAVSVVEPRAAYDNRHAPSACSGFYKALVRKGRKFLSVTGTELHNYSVAAVPALGLSTSLSVTLTYAPSPSPAPTEAQTTP